MAILHVFPEDKKIRTKGTRTILDAAKQHKIPMAHICGGQGRCTTCRVRIDKGLENCAPRNKIEQDVANQMSFDTNIRLGCQTQIKGDVQVRRLMLEYNDIKQARLYIKSKSNAVGMEKHILILFADIRGFTSFAESLLPYDVIHVLNRYFHIMEDVISNYGGYIDNYMGDGLMALFETDENQEGAFRAVKTGLAMLRAVKTDFQPYLKKHWNKTLNIRIGLHYGLVVAGVVGTARNRKSTVIGDAVNFASRVESANKEIGSEFLISQDVYELISARIRADKKSTIHVPGKTGTYKLYEVVGLKETKDHLIKQA